MRYFVISMFSVLAFISFNASAANVTVKWFGVVPSLDCSSRPISNQIDFNSLDEKCKSEFKIETKSNEEKRNEDQKIVSFDM
ncbi:hypothetical protein M445_12480 [Vibrio owensii 47666-1]|uniref:hypothetical protein n=1 Tax=Vibrio owensii TaxID=696485 RepID=UPI000585104D|nr:hypothetical protein [Vibrio owensii]KIF47795.1 hypothetical protein M445_12480 [Vibrio owensii 47666-1]